MSLWWWKFHSQWYIRLTGVRKCCPGVYLRLILVVSALVLHPTWQWITSSTSCACLLSVTRLSQTNQTCSCGRWSSCKAAHPLDSGGPRGGVWEFLHHTSLMSHPPQCASCTLLLCTFTDRDLEIDMCVAPWLKLSCPQKSFAHHLTTYPHQLFSHSGSHAALLSAARFTNLYISLVGQKAAPKKCVFLSTARDV